MSWAQRLKRVFNIDMQTCSACGGAVKGIACIEDSAVIEKILTHLQEKVVPGPKDLLPQSRSPPAGLSDQPNRSHPVIRWLLPTGRGRISLGPEKKMKVQAGKKTGKQASERAGIGQASTPTRTKNSLNGSSINARFRIKGFYSAYTHLGIVR